MTFEFGSTVSPSVECLSFTSCIVVSPAHKAGSQPVLLKVNGYTNKKSTALRFAFH